MDEAEKVKLRKPVLPPAQGRCLCSGVRVEMDMPAFWAWHDHTAATRKAQGTAMATWVGTWKRKFRVLDGEELITCFDDPETRTQRHFCSRCGTPILYVRPHAPKWVNVPRSLFESGVGREPRYHVGIDEMPEWAYRNEPLKPLRGFPGVVWTGASRRRKSAFD